MPLAEWEVIERERRENAPDRRGYPQSNAHRVMDAAGPAAKGLLYSTETCAVLTEIPTVEELAKDPQQKENVDAITTATALRHLQGDPAAQVARLEELSAEDGPYDLLVAANELRHLARRGADPSLVRRGFRAVLAALDDGATFRHYHKTFDTVARTLYLAWVELPPGTRPSLPEVPDWPSLLADEALRSRYHDLYPADELPPAAGADPRWDFIVSFPCGTPEQEIRRIEKDRSQNYRRWNRLSALFECRALREALAAVE